MKNAPSGARAAILTCASLCAVATVQAQNGTWIGTTTGTNWSDTANWADTNSDTVGDPPGTGGIAGLGTADIPVANFTVNLNAPVDVSRINFGDADAELTPGSWLLAGASTLNLSGTAILDTAVAARVDNVISGSAGLVKNGSDNLILTAANTFTGNVSVNAGQLTTKNGAALGANTINLADGTTYRYERTTGNASTFQGPAISAAPAATITITSDNAANGYSGLITADANSTVNICAPGALTQCSFSLGANTQQFGGVLGTVRIADGGSIRFSSTSGVNNGGTSATFDTGLSGLITTRNSGVVNLGALTGSGILSGSSGATGTGIFSIGAKGIDSTFSGVVQDGNTGTGRIGALTKVGAAKLTLTGTNTYTGATNVNAGTLEIGNGGSTGSLGNTTTTVAAGATLAFNTGGPQLQPGVITGAGAIVKRGTGRTSFTAANTYSAGTVIEGGELAIHADSGLGDAAGAVNFTTGSGKLVSDAAGVITARSVTLGAGATGGFGAADATDSLRVDGPVSGDGALEIGGSGVVTLTNANSYLGATTVTGGTLVANNAAGSATSGGAVNVTAGTLGGTGSIAGAVTIASGAGLRPGNVTTASTGVESLATGSLALSGGATLFIEFANSSSHDTVSVANAGGLTTPGASAGNPVLVDLRLENSAATFTTLGTYNLIQYSGTFTGNANDLFEVAPASQQAGITYTFGTSGGFITLTLSGTAPPEWNVDADGNWATASNWVNGVPNGSGVSAILGTAISAPRSITLAAPATVGSLTFNNANSYTIGGGSTLTLDNGSSDAAVTVLLGSHQIAAPVSVNDPLDLVLGHETDSLAITGPLDGSAALNKSSAGNLFLGGNNTLFSSDVDFSNGTLSFASGGLGSGDLALDDAMLQWADGNTQDVSGRTIGFGSGTVTFDTNGNDVTLANDIGNFGTAAFVKSGSGKLTLAADTTFPGMVTIEAASEGAESILQLGNGGATGSVIADIANNGELHVARSGETLFTNLISGSGKLVHHGPGSLQLVSTNTFTGTTSITGGSIALFNGQALQSSTLSYMNGGGTLDFDLNFAATLGGLEGDKDLVLMNSDLTPLPVALTIGGNGQATTYDGNLSGDGSFTKTGPGVTILGGTHTYTGATTVNGGAATGALELDFGSSITAGALTVTGDSRFSIFEGSYSTAALSNISNGGSTTATFELFSGAATFSGGLNATGNGNNRYLISVAGGTLNTTDLTLGRTNQSLTAEPVAGSNTHGLYLGSGEVNVSGALLMGNGAGTNSSVNVKVDGGTLNVAGPLTIGLSNGGRWSVVDVNGGTLNSTDAVTGIQLGGAAQGNAALIVNFGTATAERIQFGQADLPGTHVLRIVNGELYVGSGGLVDGSTADSALVRLTGGILGAKAPWSTTLPVELTNTAEIRAADALNVPNDITLDGPVTGSGGLVKSGGGTLTLDGTYAYAGGTTVNNGTLTLPTATLDDAAPVELSSAGTLNLTHNSTDTVKGFFIDGDPQEPGTWGRVGSPTAMHTTPLITGDGILNVLPDDPYAGWIAGFPGLSGPDAEKGADPDGDGMTNLEEFAFDGEPDKGAASGKIRSRIETVGAEQALVLTLPVRDGAAFDNLPGPGLDAAIDQVAYSIQGTNDLANFDQAVTEVTPDTAGMPGPRPGWSYRAFRLNGAVPARGPKGFIAATAAEEAP